MSDQIIIVDEKDVQTGVMNKLEVHQKGLLHRAFSIFIFNSSGELLLQQRALDKYHSAGLWSNTCCSHPAPGESVAQAASRRLMEEMGLPCKLTPAFSFIYKAHFDNGLIEHEFDHVFFGVSDGIPVINRGEVNDWMYLTIPELIKRIERYPECYTAWLKDCLGQVCRQQELLFGKERVNPVPEIL